ncbi:hypothetical protein BBK36DRAFT_1125328 [Trichoderma citrinoviride]|uniref:Peptidase M20 dimerisation domain-containing protein n=1 Tax=Trichoderma citrinoviride TaxID=58853 RepID=A0A2T4B3M6_9HYPO|nr:hypothetical protein BBK36DRAFT_1125328 [Trichoderma citrinoviride]PTB63914.1 hypothetical protein BBK36DRAFT_1125328 [Trichoderma citrinoviride]
MWSKSSVISLLIAGGHAADLTNLPALLSNISASIYPDLRQIAQDVWNHPEIGLAEHYAHDRVVDYYTNTRPGQWTVTPSSFGMPTAWTLEFENRPAGTPADAELPTIGFMAEYDALVDIHHACGHNHILLVALAMADFARQAAIDLGIPARLIVQGTPDEENGAGKHTLLEAGAFDSSPIWLFGHPANANGIVPMNARLNVYSKFIEDTHAAAVKRAYQGMLAVRDIDSASGWPGTGSTATPVEDVFNAECNVVQGAIAFGLEGPSLSAVQSSVTSLLATGTYPSVNCSVENDLNVKTGVNVTCLGPSGHASADTNGPLVLAIELFRTYSATASNTFFLPGNMTSNELDVVFDLRTRWTEDLDAIAAAVESAIAPTVKSTSTDTPYPSFEVPTQDLVSEVIRLVNLPDYGSQTDWITSPVSAASTDASWPQGNVVDPTTHAVTSADRVVLMPFWNLCKEGGICAYNHEAAYAAVANTPYSYQQTEVMARVMAHLTVELLTNATMLENALSITKA